MSPAPPPADAAAGATAVLGGTSFVGRLLLHRPELGRVHAFTRGPLPPASSAGPEWHLLTAGPPPGLVAPRVLSLAPLWTLPEHLPLLEALGCRRLVALSSTSRFTKRSSPARADRALAARLVAAEESVLGWAAGRGVGAVLLRPTLVYDGIHDGNVTAIADMIRRRGCFVRVGRATGLRQPVHADDVAAAMVAAALVPRPRPAYELSGGETLSYREMVARIFAWLGRPERIITVPRWAARAGLALAPTGSRLAAVAAIGLRMDEDLVFDHAAATADLGFQPRGLALPPAAAPDHA